MADPKAASESMHSRWIEFLGFVEFFGLCAIRALFPSRWLGVMSGVVLLAGLMVPLAIYTHQDWPLAYQAWFSVLWLCYIPIGVAAMFIALRLLISPFLIYRESKLRHAQAVSDLNAKCQADLAAVAEARDTALKKLSDLSGLHGHILNAAYFESSDNRVGIAVGLRLTNRGEPSIADGWGIAFDLDGLHHQFPASHFGDGRFEIPDGHGNIVRLRHEDMLFNKVGTTPVLKGGRESGFLVFLTRGLSYHRLAATRPRITLFFRDAFGHEYKVKTEGDSVSIPFYEPGMDDPFIPILARQAETIRKMVAYISEKIKQPGVDSLKALQLCKADELPTNDALVQLCDELEKSKIRHPLKFLTTVPKSDWLLFLQDAKTGGVDLGDSSQLLKYRLEKSGFTEQVPTGLSEEKTSVKPPS